MLRKIGKRAQTTAEYAILIALVVAAVTAMQIYVKRGLQGKVRDVVDNMSTGMGIVSNGNAQFEPSYVNNDFNTTSNSNTTANEQAGGNIHRDITADHTGRTGQQQILAP